MSILHYTESGQGEALVLLHSGGMSSEEWNPQVPYFAKHFRVITPDKLGHGKSPMIAEKLTIGDIGRSVIKLLDTLDIQRAHLVGSSMGGAVALWLTVHHPERVNKLVVYRIGYCKNTETHGQTRAMADPEYWKRMGMHQWLSRIHAEQGGPDAWTTVIGRVSEALDPTDTEHAHDTDTLGAVTHPTLIVVGDRDPLVPLEQALEMYRAMPDAGLWVMPYATHVTATNTWRSDSFALEVTRFLKRR